MIDLKMVLNVYNDNKKINEFTKEGGAAALELAAALSYKIVKNCKSCAIDRNPYKNELRAVVLFDERHHHNGGGLIIKYEYLFTGGALRSLSIGL